MKALGQQEVIGLDVSMRHGWHAGVEREHAVGELDEEAETLTPTEVLGGHLWSQTTGL